MSNTELFVKLARPDAKGKSRWVSVKEFTGEYKDLQLGNGGSWCRKESTLAREYLIEFDKTLTAGNSIDRIRLIGKNTTPLFNQTIRPEIRDFYKDQNCVMLGIKGTSANTKIEIDHKNGRKDDERVSNPATQKPEDFQPLCKAANDVKRQICKRCKETTIRWDAQNIKGNPYPFYEGDENYNPELGCKGCYQYDPVEYRMTSVKKISKEAADFIMNKLYGLDC
ncbi:hypothetical protein FACS1894200_03920 [Spirochaetia bacterium]|nr:hypothetical protein FACS1894200_03920 [Spirochaetia bacterium]